jgi:DNA/RNA endonuclease G (NUC1)
MYVRLVGAFSAGFGLAVLLFANDANTSAERWMLLRPLKLLAATVQNSPPQPSGGDLVPYKPPAVVSTDDSLITVQSNRTREIMKHGYPSLDNLRIFDDYVLAYDRRNRVAHWVFEHLKYERLKPGEEVDRGKSEFKEDTNIHPYFRSSNQDYRASGYDRGHLAAAANHRSSQRLMDQTFFLSNMAPQVLLFCLYYANRIPLTEHVN